MAPPVCSSTESRWKACGLDNLAIARILSEIADLLEIKNDNPFKIRAYRNGADIVAKMRARCARPVTLREIPGRQRSRGTNPGDRRDWHF